MNFCEKCHFPMKLSALNDVCPKCRYNIFDPFIDATLEFYRRNKKIITQTEATINFSASNEYYPVKLRDAIPWVPKQYICYNRVENYVSINLFNEEIILREKNIVLSTYIANERYTSIIAREEIKDICYGRKSEKFVLTLKDGSNIQPVSYPLEIQKLLVVYWFFQQSLR